MSLNQKSNMKFSKFTPILDCEQKILRHDPAITGIAYDSRKVRPGFLFVACPGEKQDGAAFIGKAIASGAVAVVSESPQSDSRVGWIQVSHARRALAQIAQAFYDDPASRLSITGITGTNGKTTTAWMTRHLLEQAGRRTALISTIEYQLGNRTLPALRTTPESLDLAELMQQALSAGCGHLVMEVSSHAIAQERVHAISFAHLVFTSLTRDHLDYHGDMESYFQAKRKLFVDAAIQTSKPQCVVHLDLWGRRLASELEALNIPCLRIGEGGEITCEEQIREVFATRLTVCTPWGRQTLRIPMPGEHNVANALGALAVAVSDGVALSDAATALEQMPGVPGRLERFRSPRGADVFVDYAHTPDALGRVLEVLRKEAAGRLIVVFGCGGDRDVGKRSLMGSIASALADRVILTNDNARNEDPLTIIGQIMEGAKDPAKFTVETDRLEAIRMAIAESQEGDLVLIAGKGHEQAQEMGGVVIPFSDRDTVKRLMEEAS